MQKTVLLKVVSTGYVCLGTFFRCAKAHTYAMIGIPITGPGRLLGFFIAYSIGSFLSQSGTTSIGHPQGLLVEHSCLRVVPS